MRAAHEAGVPVYVGTDAGGSLPHGLVAQEAAQLVEAGLTPVEALYAGTWARAPGWAARGSRRGQTPTSSSSARTRARTLVCSRPYIVLRGRETGDALRPQGI